MLFDSSFAIVKFNISFQQEKTIVMLQRQFGKYGKCARGAPGEFHMVLLEFSTAVAFLMVPLEYVCRQAHLRAPFMRAAHKGCYPSRTGGLGLGGGGGGILSPQQGGFGAEPRKLCRFELLVALECIVLLQYLFQKFMDKNHRKGHFEHYLTGPISAFTFWLTKSPTYLNVRIVGR